MKKKTEKLLIQTQQLITTVGAIGGIGFFIILVDNKIHTIIGFVMMVYLLVVGSWRYFCENR